MRTSFLEFSRHPLLLAGLTLAVACSQGSEPSGAGAPTATGSNALPGQTASGGAGGLGGNTVLANGSASGGTNPAHAAGMSHGSGNQEGAGTQDNGGDASQLGGTSNTGGASGGDGQANEGGSSQTGGAPSGSSGTDGTEPAGGSTDSTDTTSSGTGPLPASDCKPNGRAPNPLVTQIFTADPNAVVYGDRVYVYTSHDIDGQDDFDMVDYHVFSSTDMVNWQDHGVIIHANDLPWATNLYAPGACSKNGKYYLYIPNSGSGIGVAVADDPGGPFVDPLGEALLTKSFPNADVEWLFDPACFVDDDGQGYLYFGGGPDGGQNARVVRLNDDMISIKDSAATTIPTTAFFEAAFVHRRGDTYYFSYSSDFSSGHGAAIEYLIGDGPMSGFEYQGKILNNANINRGNNNHHSIVDFEGKTYIFYHNRKLEQELGVDKVNNRSIAVQELTYLPDGTFSTLDMSTEDYTVEQIKCLDGFQEIEAERLAEQRGIEVEGAAGGIVRVAQISAGDWVAYSQVDFRDGATQWVARVASAAGSGSIDIVIDGCIGGKAGTSIGTCQVMSTGAADTYATLTCPITETSGPHDLCLKFADNPSFELDSFHLE